MLEVKGLNVYYGAIHAVKNISFEINDGEIVTIIGSNGAGKSSTMNALAGIQPHRSGEIRFNGGDMSNAKNTGIVASGIVLVPEGRHVFSRMSVEENLIMGAYLYHKDQKGNQEHLQMVYDLFPRLHERCRQKAGTLSGGEQQMLAIGRGLMSRPKVLMLDEPSLGLAPIIIQQIFEMLKEINRKNGVTILLVEQNARMALNLANRAYVLDNGKIILDGPASELMADPRVKEAYL